jgi:hypothetical protein
MTIPLVVAVELMTRRALGLERSRSFGFRGAGGGDILG